MTDKFAVQTSIHVRFSDTDAMGHVNNAAYISYMEQGRVAYIQKLLPDVDMKRGLDAFPFILADIQCSFKAPLYCDDVVVVSIGVAEIGTKSFVFDYALHEESSGRLVATGRSVQVMYDYANERTYPIPPEIRQSIEALEGRSY